MRKRQTKASRKETRPARTASVSNEIELGRKKLSRRVRDYDKLAALQGILSAPCQHLEHDWVTKAARDGAIDLYDGLEPENALEAILSMLLVSVSTGSLDALSAAARISPRAVAARDLHFRLGLKGAREAANLAETLVQIRGGSSSGKRVTVGKVSVESGGQAIVGNVHAEQRNKGDLASDDAQP
jgi:hypothetical protein